MMRRTAVVRHPKSRAFIYFCAILALMFYAVPKIPALHRGLGGTFSMVWILFAGLALSANLYFMVGADKERSQLLEVRGHSQLGEEKQDKTIRRAL